MRPLTLVTSNLLNGLSITDGTVDTARMVRSLTALQPSVLAMQEVDRFQSRSGSVDQAAAVATAISGAQWRFVPAIMGVPGQAWRPATSEDPASGHDLPLVHTSSAAFGTALITTLDVQQWHVIRVDPFPHQAPVYFPGGGWKLIDDEPRVCIAAVVDCDGITMTVAATHTSFVPGWNVRQLHKIGRALRHLPAPRFLLGDLNLPSPVPATILRWSQLAGGHATFPAPSPVMQLDHVLLDDPGSRFGGVFRSRAHHLDFSDHRAVSVDYAET